ncbi:MAG: hypothetical protein J4432_04590 [DPANN group archaeon]|nr:hypothetical protein [DPANN group archaeon]
MAVNRASLEKARRKRGSHYGSYTTFLEEKREKAERARAQAQRQQLTQAAQRIPGAAPLGAIRHIRTKAEEEKTGPSKPEPKPETPKPQAGQPRPTAGPATPRPTAIATPRPTPTDTQMKDLGLTIFGQEKRIPTPRGPARIQIPPERIRRLPVRPEITAQGIPRIQPPQGPVVKPSLFDRIFKPKTITGVINLRASAIPPSVKRRLEKLSSNINALIDQRNSTLRYDVTLTETEKQAVEARYSSQIRQLTAKYNNTLRLYETASQAEAARRAQLSIKRKPRPQ